MADYDIVIRQGTVIDGLRTPRYVADVGIRDGRIAHIGKIPAASGGTVIDAEGLIVAPGVVDLHTHYDAQVFWDPYCTMSSWHGVTSVVIGNCGFGLAPVDPEARDRAMLTLSRNEAISLDSMQEGLPTPWPWVSFPEFLDAIDATPQGRQHAELRRARPGDDLRDGTRGSQEPAGDSGGEGRDGGHPG